MGFFVFNLPAFIIGLIVGLSYMFLLKPSTKTVTVYPSPYNAGNITYEDDADTCFQYVASKVKCPDDKSKVKPQPLNIVNSEKL